ncbi:DUF1642 domain-containing protein [Enterococcus avium]|uniref:DUF1642 domain-containing protein n=1 Tax=Enterococcus avium TaxID=33945 RepID=UPI003D0C4679
MNKKVLIDKQALIDELMKIPGVGSNSDALETIKRFPSYEPQKPVVPKCAEQWIEGHCAPSDVVNLFIEVTCATDSDGFIDSKWRWSTDFYEWLANDADTLYILCDALRYGYEVEKEPKWKIINDQKYCLTSIEAGYGNSLHWAFDSTKKRPILFDNEETAMYTTYITGGIVEKVEV